MATAVKEVRTECEEVEVLTSKSLKALEVFRTFNQEQVDKVIQAMTEAGVANERYLAEFAVQETGMGNVEDKVIKNHFGTQVVSDYMRDGMSVGVIEEKNGIISIAEPFGVVAAVTPTTNPTSTTMFKALIALKGRNVIIFAFHPRAQKCSAAAARIMHDAAVAAGAPQDCIQWITQPSIEATDALMRHPDVAIIVATGGAAMVKAAYSSGHPALGVGPGDVPVYIEKSANLPVAVDDVIASKTFDNGTICSADQSVIFDDQGDGGEGSAVVCRQGRLPVHRRGKGQAGTGDVRQGARRSVNGDCGQERAGDRRAGGAEDSGGPEAADGSAGFDQRRGLDEP